jgi:hypothetical protein
LPADTASEVDVRIACVWCRREGRGSDLPDAAAVVGLCDDHIRRFTAEVDAALQGRSRERRSEGPPVSGRPPRRAGRRVSDRLVEQVADILVRNARTDLCDPCIAGEVGCAVADVQEATTRLAASLDFLRDQWRCGRCGSRQMVTRARSRLLRPRSSSSPAA